MSTTAVLRLVTRSTAIVMHYGNNVSIRKSLIQHQPKLCLRSLASATPPEAPAEVLSSSPKSSSPSATVSADASPAVEVTGSPTNSSPQTQRKNFSIYDMDAKSIAAVNNPEDIEDLICQVEKMPELHSEDVATLIMPLSRLTSHKMHRERGAMWTERLLITCLSRLPAEIKDRYALNKEARFPYPPSSLYNRAIIMWAHLSNAKGAERAESLFQMQLQEYLRERTYLQETIGEAPLAVEVLAPQPDRKNYKSRLRAWAVSGESDGASRAYAILREMEELSGLPALLKAHDDDKLTDEEQHQPQNTTQQLPPIEIEMPDLSTYNVVMSVYAKKYVLQHPINLERVKKIASRVNALHEVTGSKEYKLDGYSYTSILQAYSRWINFCPAPLDPKYCRQIFSILTTIHKIIESPEYQASLAEPKYSENFKKKMDGTYDKRNDDTSIFFPLSMSFAYGLAVEALLKTQPFAENLLLADEIVVAMTGRRNRINTGDDKSAPLSIPPNVLPKIWPSQDLLRKVVYRWEQSGLPNREKRMERLLYVAVVEARYPRIHFLHEAMEQWCTSGWKNTPELLEAMLDRSFEVTSANWNKPTGQTFNIVMKGWMRANTPESPQRVEQLFMRMLRLFEDQGDTWYVPQEIHLRYVMTSWFNRCQDGRRYDGMSGENLYPAEHCERIARWLLEKPWVTRFNILTGQFGLATRAWSMQTFQPDDPDKPNPVQRSASLLDDLATRNPDGEKLPAYPCNWVLEACKREQPDFERRKEAYDTAIATFGRASQNSRTFALMVEVIRHQVNPIDAWHLKVVEDLFVQCCSQGMLTQEMIWNVAGVAPAETLQRLFGLSHLYAAMIVTTCHDPSQQDFFRLNTPSGLRVENLPQEWSAVSAAEIAKRQKIVTGHKKK